METITDIVVAFFLVVGALFTVLGSLGMARFPDLLTRLHGPSKATTLGLGSLLIASIIFFSLRGEGLSVHELLITFFVAISTPVSAQFIAKAARGERGQGTRSSALDSPKR